MPNPTIRERFSKAWNAFLAKEKRGDAEYITSPSMGYTTTYREDKPRLRLGSERTIIASIYNRIAVDVAAINLQHCRVDRNGKYLEPIDSELNQCLRLSANIDQTAREFMIDGVLSLLDEGQIAVVPVDTTTDITNNNSYDILSLRVGRITQWHPEHVRIDLYNDRTGRHEEITLPKAVVAIIENPFYEVMNKLVAEGKCVIMISSEMPEILGMSDRVIVMRGGKITGEMDRDTDRFNQEDIMKAAWEV